MSQFKGIQYHNGRERAHKPQPVPNPVSTKSAVSIKICENVLPFSQAMVILWDTYNQGMTAPHTIDKAGYYVLT